MLLVGLSAGSFAFLLFGGGLVAVGVLFATSKAPPATKIVTVLDTDPDFALRLLSRQTAVAKPPCVDVCNGGVV